MRLITAIVPHPRRAGRVDVAVDGASVGAVSVDVVSRLGLKVGTAFEPVQSAFEAERAMLVTWDRATGILAAHARSRSELRRRLVLKGEPPAQVDQVLDRLERAGYLDDAEFARQFARSKMVGSGMSRRRVQQELAKRGVERALADAAVAEVFVDEEVNEVEAVERLARKKLRSLAKYDEPTRRRRLYSFLARRGYDGEDIRDVLGRIGVEADD